MSVYQINLSINKMSVYQLSVLLEVMLLRYGRKKNWTTSSHFCLLSFEFNFGPLATFSVTF